MDNLNEKLNTFTSLVLEDAKTERDKLMEKVQQKHDAILNAKENDFLEEAYSSIHHSITDAKKAASEKILHFELDAKKQILLTRENIINEVMEDAKIKLKEYTKTSEYEKWLIKKVETALKEVGKGSKVVYVSTDDLRMKNKIEAFSTDSETVTVNAAEEKDFIGGIKVFNPERHVSVNYSFKEMLADEKETFLQSSGLNLD